VRERCDVAIVGYGPTGQTLAILLAQRGWRVTVLERWPTAYPMPRAIHFDHEVGRIFQAAGVADEVRAICDPCHSFEWRNGAGETLLEFGLSSQSRLSGWPAANIFHQPDLERVLDRRVRSLSGVSVRRGFQVFAIEPRDECVYVRARDASGTVRDVEARYAVGCDGANSFVRRWMRAPVEDLGLAYGWLIIDLITRRPRELESWLLCDPRRPTAVNSGGPGRRRFEFMRLPNETLESLCDSRMAWQLLAPWGLSESDTILERHMVYTFHARWAETWRSGRVLLAGDAAHVMPPFVAEGLGSDLRDAATLAWKLDLVLAGRAPEVLLDTYAQERLPQVRSLIDLAISLGRMICMTDPDEAAARDAALLALGRAAERPPMPAPPAMGPGTTLAGDPHAGELSPQGRVRMRSPGRACEGLFDDVVGRGWVLLGADGDPGRALGPDQRAFFASLGGVSAHIGAGAPLADLDGRYERFFESTGVRIVLVRPDFHVFGTAKDPAEASGLIDSLARELASPSVAEEKA
jgi:2-polyprenyl-6-methoxyphenol hydroxylase-like FAD-dependent oxidoreductase